MAVDPTENESEQLPHIPAPINNPPYVPPETPATPIAGSDVPVSPGPEPEAEPAPEAVPEPDPEPEPEPAAAKNKKGR